MQIFTIVVISVIRMRRRHHVRDAIRRSGLAHGDGHVPGFRAVVYFRKNVRMNVDHN
jgi:hypothetical protein